MIVYKKNHEMYARCRAFNLLSTKLYLPDLKTHSYRAVNTVCLGYKDGYVNAV